MPTDNEPINLSTGTLFFTNPNTGDRTPLGTAVDIHMATIVPDPISPESVHWINKSPEATFTIRIPAKKMSRKRFVKKLMASSVPRNVANDVADLARTHGHSYAWAYLVISCGAFLPWES